LYAESCLLDEKYQTKKYFVLWMWSLNWKRMSASRWNAIFVNDLINSYGPNKSRMIILLGWWHPSKNYDFDTNLPSYVDKLLNNFTNYYSYLLSISNWSIIIDSNNISINIDENTVSNIIEENINKWYYRQAIIELISILPSKYQYPDKNSSIILLSIYKRYLYILLPNLLDNFIIN
jgi:cysteinyl-tRNA synthetase